MKASEICQILNAEILCGKDNLDVDVKTAFGADMMSDVLAFVKDQAVLLTGLVNPQVIRTAEMMDMRCVVFVRNKMPNEDMIPLAADAGIVLMASPILILTYIFLWFIL